MSSLDCSHTVGMSANMWTFSAATVLYTLWGACENRGEMAPFLSLQWSQQCFFREEMQLAYLTGWKGITVFTLNWF